MAGLAALKRHAIDSARAGVFLVAILIAFTPQAARAAGGAFAVDDAGVDDVGACKVESWAAFAGNSDFMGTVAPACVVGLGRPVELGVQVQRSREGSAWGTALGAKAKTNILPITPGGIGLALSGGITYDVTNRTTSGVFLAAPLTFEINDRFRINVNGGWLWDPSADEHFATWGAGFEWKFLPNQPLTLIGEVFGAAGSGADSDPGAQLGLRFTPVEAMDIDVIYGRNLTGENANWITVGLNVRFSVLDK